MLKLYGEQFRSRMLLGTAQYPSPEILASAIKISGAEIITVSLRRQKIADKQNSFWQLLKQSECRILPNTAGCFTAKEAIATAQMARELFATDWIKLEVIGDDYTLQPNGIELIKAAEILVQQGFKILPYCTEDLIICQALIACGCEVLMPWAAPIGTGQGINNPYGLQLLRERFPVNTLIIDAGIGRPSHATEAMEMGFDAILLNTAVAKANDPVKMAKAFSLAIESGRKGFTAGIMAQCHHARASTPLIDKPFWLTENAK